MPVGRDLQLAAAAEIAAGPARLHQARAPMQRLAYVAMAFSSPTCRKTFFRSDQRARFVAIAPQPDASVRRARSPHA
jgi:hypothetical protein